MSWLTPLGFLGFLGLVALIIIYIIKPNYQNKIISTTYIWKLSLKLRKKQVPISKLRNILLFICQVLAISALAFILAQPVIAAQEEEENGEKIVIIDASVSMFTEYNEETRFERAVESVRLLANEIYAQEDGRGITVIVAAEKASVLVSGVTHENKDMLYEALDTLIDPQNKGKPLTYGKADVEAAIKLAEERTSIDPYAEVLLYTDTKYIDPGKIVVKDVKDPAEWNASILDVRAIAEENYFRFEVDVACFGGVDQDIEVFIDIFGVNSDEVTLSAGGFARCIGGETTTLVFAKNLDNGLSLEENGITQDISVFSYSSVAVRIEERDSFDYDNSFELHGGAKIPLRIQYYSSAPNNFFATALLVLRDTLSKRWAVEFVEVKPDEEPAYEGFDFYIFEHNLPENKIPQDGVVILANPSQIPSIAGIRLGRAYTAPNEARLQAGEDADHALMKGITPENISVTKFTELTAADGYATLMSVSGGERPAPVVMAKNEPDQKIVVMSFSLNYSNFSMLLDFPLFMYNIFQYYSPSTLTEYVYEVNDEVSLNSRSEMLVVTDKDENETEITEFPSTLPLKTPGVYAVSQTPIDGEKVTEYFFVKLPESECNIAEELDSLSEPYFAAVEEKADFDLLMYFALTLVLLLFAEWWLQTREQF